tara:strand:+ start:4513 stop:4857 length:345 start_codon:yes stop_codon:yes gene_type:complete
MAEEQTRQKHLYKDPETGEKRDLYKFEKCWIIHQYCGIPYTDAKGIDERSEEFAFLMAMAGIQKQKIEQERSEAVERERQLASQFDGFANVMQNVPHEEATKAEAAEKRPGTNS